MIANISKALVLFAFLGLIGVGYWLENRKPDPGIAQGERPKTRCCWCVFKLEPENEVTPFVSNEHCESRVKVGSYKSCRAVTIEEQECKLVALNPDAMGETRCEPSPLSYFEDGKLNYIQPSQRIPAFCGGLNAGDDTEMAGGGNSSASSSSKEDSSSGGHHCQCTQDPDFSDHCAIMRQEKDQSMTRIERRPKKNSSDDCNKVCSKLFPDWNNFQGICSQRN